MAEGDETSFRVTTRATGGELILSVFGDVDIATAPKLFEAMGAALDRADNVILDLAEMTFIDSQGLKVLIQAHARAQEGRPRRVVLRSPRPQARKVLEITGLDQVLAVED